MHPDTDKLTTVTDIMRRVFAQPALVVSPATSARDVPDWDSLNHVALIMEVEKTFGIRFGLGELQDLQNVGSLVALVERKCASAAAKSGP